MIKSKITIKIFSPLCSLPYALCLLTLLIFNYPFLIEAQATIRYVSHTGSSTTPYTSWETAADSIQKAIDICNPGDTVIVANGIYYEGIYVNKTINLWGSSIDSTVIDGSTVTVNNIVYFFENNSTFKNFTIKGPIESKVGINCWFSNIKAIDCKIINVRTAMIVASSSVIIERFLISNFIVNGIYSICPDDTCNDKYYNNIIFSSDLINTVVYNIVGGSSILINNIIIEDGNTQNGVAFEQKKRVTFKNNLVSGFQGRNIQALSDELTDTVFLINNNSMNVQNASGFYTYRGDKAVIRNNIIQNTNIGISGFDAVSSDYNLFKNVNIPVNGGAYLGEGNVFADPMFVNDTIPVPNGTYDLHLQAYSPAIDSGDLDILDIDETRSDIGMFGGPDGEKYVYLDLPPRTPKNFTYSFDSTYRILTLGWDMAAESDFSHYNIYRDTVSGFTPGAINLIAQTDTSNFIDDLSKIKSKGVYFRITAVDNQENESQPGNEIAVLIVGVTPEVEIIRDYILYQNFPNPFNPSTKISYEIKNRSYVKLMVYDIKGELISVLVNKEQDAGYYEVEFNSRNLINQIRTGSLASGIYLYRIEVIGEGNIPVYSDMKKMILVK